MGHEINVVNGKASMAYIGSKPWHGLGQEMSPDATLDVWKKEAGMEWFVNRSCLEWTSGIGRIIEPSKHVLYRSDNDAYLSNVSQDYKVVQPRQLIDFFGSLIKNSGFQMSTAGVLFNGVVYWALAKVGEGFELPGGDAIEPYLLVATSCDGSMSTALQFTSVQVVCKNTLHMAIGQHGRNAKVKISHKALFDFASAYEKLGIIERKNKVTSEFEANARLLCGIKLSDEVAKKILAKNFKKLLAKPDASDSEIIEKSNALKRIMKLYNEEAITSNLASSKGTAWGLVGAVTQYSDYDAGTVNGDPSRAFYQNHFGTRANFKMNVVNDLLTLV